MIKNYFDQKIALFLNFLILANYLLFSLSAPTLLIQINYVLFLTLIFIFYFKNPLNNIYLKIFFLLVILISLGSATSGWDARSIWLFHAKRIFYDNSIFSIADNYASFSHNDYPNLVPAFSAALGKLFGHWNEIFPKISFILMFFPPMIFIYPFFKENRYLILLSIVFFIIGRFLFNGWSDGLVAVYFSLSTFLMYFLIIKEDNESEKKTIYYLTAFTFFIFLTLIKNEGTVLLLILFIVTFLTKIFITRSQKNIVNFFYLSFSFLPIILWKLFCYEQGIVSDYVNNDSIQNLLPRVFEISNYKLIAYFLLLNEKFFISFIFFLLVFWLKKNKELFIFILAISISYLIVLFFIFLSTPVDFYFQLDSAAARVVKTLSFLLSFFAIYNLKKKIS